MQFLKVINHAIIFVFVLFFSLNIFSCNKKDNEIVNLTDSLIIPMPMLIHINLSDSLTEPVSIRFRILKGAQILYITPQLHYFRIDSILNPYALNFPNIQINGLNQFHNIDTLIKLGQPAFFNNHYGGPGSFHPGDQWIISYMVSMNDGRYLKNRYSNIVTWDNYFSGLYDDHILYHKPGSGMYPNDIYIDTSFAKELIAFNPLESIMDFALFGSSGARMKLFPWASDTITLTVIGWNFRVKNGDPNNSSLLTHVDWTDKVNKIYLYYYFKDSTGNNIFWETLTPH